MFTKFAIKNTLIIQLLDLVLIPLNLLVFLSILVKSLSLNNTVLAFIVGTVAFLLLFVPIFLMIFFLIRRINEDYLANNFKKIFIVYLLNFFVYIFVNGGAIVMTFMNT